MRPSYGRFLEISKIQARGRGCLRALALGISTKRNESTPQEGRMSIKIPDRFIVARALREDSYARTFVGHDRLFDNCEVVVKIFRRGTVDRDRLSPSIEQYARLIGLKHKQLAPIFDLGLTRRRQFFY